MKSIKFLYIIVLGLFLIYCQSTKQIRTYNDLSLIETGDDVKIITVDTSIYNIEGNNIGKHTYNDSTISFVGKKEKKGLTTNFSGELNFKDIAYIEVNESNTLKTLGFVAITGAIVVSGSSSMSGSRTIHPDVKIKYPGGGGSCPFVYSWDGEQFNLEGEAFGTALGKALEAETSIILSESSAANNHVKVKLTNERPETHFFNNINMVAVEVEQDISVYVDNKNGFQTMTHHKTIKKVTDYNNKNVTSMFLNNDDYYWESDLSSATNEFNFEDHLILEINEINKVDSISLLFTAINTDISSSVFGFLHVLLGDELANFTRAAETDEELISILQETLDRSALKLDIWDGEKWVYTDLIYPEANYVEFKKLLRLPVHSIDDKLKIRLRCLTDVWKIDAIHFDDSPPSEKVIYQTSIIEFASDSNGDPNDIKKKDDKYIKLLPGQKISVESNSIEPSSDKKIVYAVKVGGYLYEWIIDKSPLVGKGIEHLEISTPKIKMVKNLLKNMNTFLPLIYDNWKSMKQKIAAKN